MRKISKKTYDSELTSQLFFYLKFQFADGEKTEVGCYCEKEFPYCGEMPAILKKNKDI